MKQAFRQADIEHPDVKMSEPDPIEIDGQEIPAQYADTVLSQARGHMFRTTTPDYALVFPFDDVGWRSLHMLFVPFSLDAAYVIDGAVEKVSTMKPMVGFSSGKADAVIELPSGEYDISEGDKVEIGTTDA